MWDLGEVEKGVMNEGGWRVPTLVDAGVPLPELGVADAVLPLAAAWANA